MDIGIIGGGASGMAAALAAAENPCNRVTVLERQARVGRKLLATGNGRCNLTNRGAEPSRYHGDAPEFCRFALETFSVEQTLSWFAQLGLYTVTEPSGRVYPYSDQANSVVDVLRLGLVKPNVELICGFEVKKARFADGMFTVSDGAQEYRFHRLIIACGGLAGSKLGGTLSGYQLLSRFGHSATRLRPSLVQLKTDWPGIAALKGVRANCHARIFREETLWSQSRGEVQFTDYGLSGPVIFEICRDVCQQRGSWVCRLDLLPELSQQQLMAYLLQRCQTQLKSEELLTGLLHNRLGRVVTRSAGIRQELLCRQLSEQQLQEVCRCVKDFAISLSGTLGMDSAQVTAGGIKTADFDHQTMQSRLRGGLFACGEVLDIDGDCGGFNLQWAWSSGRLAGLSAGKEDL